MDHAGGLRALLAEGGTLVVGQGAGAHFRRVLEAPATRNPDLPARSYHMNPILEVPESHVMSDSAGRQVIIYVMDNPHAKGMLMTWVPHAKLGFVTDIAGTAAPRETQSGPRISSKHREARRLDARALRRRSRLDRRLPKPCQACRPVTVQLSVSRQSSL
jgi:hypothetical protein